MPARFGVAFGRPAACSHAASRPPVRPCWILVKNASSAGVACAGSSCFNSKTQGECLLQLPCRCTARCPKAKRFRPRCMEQRRCALDCQLPPLSSAQRAATPWVASRRLGCQGYCAADPAQGSRRKPSGLMQSTSASASASAVSQQDRQGMGLHPGSRAVHGQVKPFFGERFKNPCHATACTALACTRCAAGQQGHRKGNRGEKGSAENRSAATLTAAGRTVGAQGLQAASPEARGVSVVVLVALATCFGRLFSGATQRSRAGARRLPASAGTPGVAWPACVRACCFFGLCAFCQSALRAARTALLGRNALHTASCVSRYGPPIRSMQ